MRQRVADVVAQILAEEGIRHVFLVTGGGAMHLNDALGRHPNLEYIPCHHEQACSMAAESYFRMSNTLAAVNVTSGPGGTNAITGVYGAWVDSLGMVVISGNVKFETQVQSTGLPLRQYGDQEINIIKIVESITKYSHMVRDPLSVHYHLKKAIHLARSGRPGPVWLDIPLDIQGTLVEIDQLKEFDPSSEQGSSGEKISSQGRISPLPSSVSSLEASKSTQLKSAISLLWEGLQKSSRPVLFLGSGVRIGGALDLIYKISEVLRIPVVTAWNAHDLIPDDHPYYAGRPGTIGDRAGNFTVQNADFLLVLGSRLNIRQISYNWKSFAREAFKVVVDIDPMELKKPSLQIDLPIEAHIRDFAEVFWTHVSAQPPSPPREDHEEWVKWCKERQKRYPVVRPEYWNTPEGRGVNPYCFVQTLFEELREDELIVTGNGSACVMTFQAARLKKGQRLYTNSGCASMGYDLPAAIGAYFSKKPKRLICITGDGSLQMNLQELQTINTYRLPIKIFLLNNQGYHSIRQTQGAYFPDNIVGCGRESRLSFPSYEKLAGAFDLGFRKCENTSQLKSSVVSTLESEGPQLCELILDLQQQFSPKLASRRLEDGRMVSPALEDMAPFLTREELMDNMLIPLAE